MEENEKDKKASITKQELREHFITKAAAAVEVQKETKLGRALCISAIGMVFLTAIATSANLILGVIAAGVSSVAFGYFLFILIRKLKYLKNTYDL